MIEKIFVCLMVVFALGGGIWAWWVENGPERRKNGEEMEEKGEN